MKRRFGKVLEAFWFVIAIAFGLVWVRGYWWEDEIRWKMRLDGWAPVQVRTFYARSASGCVELGTIREQRWEYREWSPQTVGYETNDWPRHPERRVIQSGWRKKCGGFGVMCDWPRERTPLGLPIPYASIVSAWAPSWFVWLVIAVMPEKWVYG